MSDYPLVQLVSAPEEDAVVRFDFNDGLTWPEHDGFSLGSPQMLGDPGGIGVELGLRTIRFNTVVATGESLARVLQSKLAVELLRHENWLRFQFSPASPPQWFQVFRSSPGEVSLARVYVDEASQSQWQIQVSLAASAYSVGEPITIGPLVVGSDPAAGGIAVELTDIKGDFPTPLVLDIPASPSGANHCPAGWFTVSALSKWGGLLVQQTVSAVPSTAGSNPTGASFSGGSATRRAFTNPLTGPVDYSYTRYFQTTITPTQAGRYRLFARARINGSGPGQIPTGSIRGAGFAQSTPGPESALSPAWDYYDLGVYTIPWGHQPLEDDYTVYATSTVDEPQVAIEVARSNVDTGSVDVDFIVAIPVALHESVGQTSLFYRASPLAQNKRVVLDGEKRLAQFYAQFDEVPDATFGDQPDQNPIVRGAFPTVDPGAAHNVLHVVRQRGFGEWTKLSDSTTLTVSYRPRWLYVAGE